MPSTAEQHGSRIKLVSWNTAGRVGRHAAQVRYLASCAADLVALQEVTTRTLTLWREAADSLGFDHVLDSFSLAPNRSVLVGPRRYGQMFLSRAPMEALPPDAFAVPWPERVLSAGIRTSVGSIEAHTTHIPPGASNGWTKIETLEGIYDRLATPYAGHRMLCGDFNMPQLETTEGEIVYWDMRQKSDGSMVRWRPERWGDSERSVKEGLAAFDLADAYRTLHPPGDGGHSWIPNHGDRRIPRRYDHLFTSRSLGVTDCVYDHAPRESGLSDHSPLLATFTPPAAGCAHG